MGVSANLASPSTTGLAAIPIAGSLTDSTGAAVRRGWRRIVARRRRSSPGGGGGNRLSSNSRNTLTVEVIVLHANVAANTSGCSGPYFNTKLIEFYPNNVAIDMGLTSGAATLAPASLLGRSEQW